MSPYFSDDTQRALKNNPPGEWLPNIPPRCIKLSAGYPVPELVPADALKAAVAKLIDEEWDLPLQYIGSHKIPKLQEIILARLSKRGMSLTEEELLITSGASQGIDLIARIFLDQETVMGLEAPTYMEALEMFQNYTKNIISIPVDEHGLQTNQLEKLLDARKQKGLSQPKLIYTIPTFQNPTGTTMTYERRKKLLALASQFDFFIIEDDAYGELAFTQALPTLKSMDQEGRVLHVGSFSKIIAPGMRVGWVAGASEVIKALAWFKKDLDHPFAQATMGTFLETIDFERRLSFLQETFCDKRDTMISALEKYAPESIKWIIPDGGYFVWLYVPNQNTTDLLESALEKGVSFIPGEYFFLTKKEGQNYLRLSFSYVSQVEITAGVKILGELLR